MITIKLMVMATLKEIFEDVAMINPKVNYISSIGSYVDANAEQLANYVLSRIIEFLPEESLAMKIVRENKSRRWSDKQLWVIAYELQKNADYCKQLDDANEQIRINEDRKRAIRREKRHRKEEFKRMSEETIAKFDEVENSTKVLHKTYGEGVIVSQDETIVIVSFNGVERKLLKKFANLKFVA